MCRLTPKRPAKDTEHLFNRLGVHPRHSWLRLPETSTVIIRGREGATFNLGEMAITRFSLKPDSGEVAHGNVQGRDMTNKAAATKVEFFTMVRGDNK
ncbi:phosphonate C-P lyase system protein PhnG [Parasulfitobacter algicola]|uniref:phosphonate C-P lyase system protein PhnG n=1 Tax=Parasulfitobacter algicola TaxID=2614809 RepID=UPI0031B585C7